MLTKAEYQKQIMEAIDHPDAVALSIPDYIEVLEEVRDHCEIAIDSMSTGNSAESDGPDV